LNILFLSAEATPFVKVGGLGDVAGSLPRALAARGHDVRLALPGYGAIDWPRFAPLHRAVFDVPRRGGSDPADLWETSADGVPVYLITGPPIPKDSRIYGGSIDEDAPKFVFFSLAALEGCRRLSWRPDVIHANDWHTGPAVYRVAADRRDDPFFRTTATLYTIHNLPYTGRGAGRILAEWDLRTSPHLAVLPEWARDSMLGIGLATADVLTTVSPTYAREIRTPEGGHGLDGALSLRGDRLHGVLNGIDVARELRKISPETKSVMLTMYPDRAYVLQSLKAGAKAYVLKSQVSEDLLRAIREVSLGEVYLSAGVAASVVEAYLDDSGKAPDPLTARERQVLQLVAEGNSTRKAAEMLKISLKTAESHRYRIMKKLKIHDAVGLVRHAVQSGLVHIRTPADAQGTPPLPAANVPH